MFGLTSMAVQTSPGKRLTAVLREGGLAKKTMPMFTTSG
ncbi:hypothetical protein [uncultured Gammaproteobacteria bacterium]|nr:hypothetical protein [uncultured Gammaproteobacteria bacterium]